MSTLRKLEDAPLPVRLIPALVGVSLLACLLGVSQGVCLAAILFGTLVLATPVLLARIPQVRMKEGTRSGEDFICYRLETTDRESLEKLASFLEERSRQGRRYLILESIDSGERTLSLIVNGEDSIEEASIVESVVSALFRGRLRLVRAGSCLSFAPLRDKSEAMVLSLGVSLSSPVPRKIGLTMRDIEGHIAVFGSTGSGKSTTLRVLATRVPDSLDVIVVDWTGEHSQALRLFGFEVVNPNRGGLGLDILQCSIGRPLALEILSRALDLTEPQAFLLSQIVESGAQSIRVVYRSIGEMAKESKWDREVGRALQRKLGTLLRGASDAFKQCSLGPLSGGRVVVDLSSVEEAFSRRALANLVLALLYAEAPKRGNRVLVILDEAHNIIRADSRDIANMVLAESRKHGLYLAYATQSPSLAGQLALLNSNTKIVHAIRSQRDKKIIIDALGLGDDWLLRLDKLERGEAILQSPSHPEPQLIRIEP